MGLHCFKDKSGLSAEPASEDSERQLDVLSRQETELTEKQSRYLALVAQLEEEKARVAAARKDLTEALSEHEIFKSTLKELNNRLRECEDAAPPRKEIEPVVDSSDTLNQELCAIQEETQRTAAELESKQKELEQYQRHLRETEKTVVMLEKLERELEHQLSEEAFKYQETRKTAYLRGLFLLLVRKAKFRSMKMLLRWHIQARRHSAWRNHVLGITLPLCPDLQPLRIVCESVLLYDLVDETQSVLMRIAGETEEINEDWQQMYIDTKEDIQQAALISACQRKSQDLERLSTTLTAAMRNIEVVRPIWNTQSVTISQAISESIQGSNSALHELGSVNVDLVDAQVRVKIEELLKTAKETRIACQTAQIGLNRMSENLASVLGDQYFTRLNDLLIQIQKYKVIAELPAPRLQSKETVPFSQIQPSGPQIVEEPQAYHEFETFEEESGEATVVEESNVASAAPEEIPVAAYPEEPVASEAVTGLLEPEMASQMEDASISPELVVLPEGLSPDDRDSILACPTLKILQTQPISDIRILPISELLAALQALLKSLSPTPSLWDSVVDYFVRQYGRKNAVGELTDLAANLNGYEEEPYVKLLAGALGLSLHHPTPLSQAYGRVVAAAILDGHLENANDGGQIPFIEAVKAVRKLFQSEPRAGQEVLMKLKPDALNDLSYLNFILCARLKEIKKDSIQLFKVIDTDNSGKLTCDELIAGIQNKLDIWMSADYIAALFAYIDKDGSGSISRLEFAKEVTFKTYMPLEKDLTISRLRFIETVGPFLHPTAQGLGELAGETKAWLEELAERALVIG